jgi:rhamnosyltransferase subunit B
MQPSSFLLVSAGGSEDTLPLVVLGSALRRRGNSVCLMAQQTLSTLAAHSGLDFTPLSPDAAPYNGGAAWEMGSGTSLPAHFVPWNHDLYKTILDLRLKAPTLTLTVHHPAILADVLAQQAAAIPAIRLLVGPDRAMSTYEMQGASSTFDDELERIAAYIPTLLRDPALPRLTAAPFSWARRVFSSLPFWGLWPAWFAATAQHGRNFTALGFVRDSRCNDSAVSRLARAPERVTFALLDAFAANPQALVERCYDFAEEICALLGCSADFLGIPQPPPNSMQSGFVHCREFTSGSNAPHPSDLLVHDASMHWVAQGLTQGLPHLVIPRTPEQANNAARLKRLGVAELLSPRDFSSRSAMASILRLCESEQVRARCDYLKSLLDETPTLSHICDMIEATVAPTGRLDPQSHGAAPSARFQTVGKEQL